MTRFSLGGDDDGQGSNTLPSKRKRPAESEGEGEEEEEEEEKEEEEEEHDAVSVEEETSVKDRFVKSSSNEEVGSILVTLTDPDVLDCPICLEPLNAPVFQCENGHIACVSCCGKIKNTCSFCTLPIGYIRCRVIERVLQSAKLRCRNADRGCKRLFCYHERLAHKRYCPFSPRTCPFHNCSFVGSSKQLSGHFSGMHASYLKLFTFNIRQAMELHLPSKIYILRERKRDVLFILRNELQSLGHAVKIEYLGPPTGRQYSYKIVAKANGSSLQLESIATDKDMVDNNCEIPFLVLPKQCFKIGGEFNFCIQSPD